MVECLIELSLSVVLLDTRMELEDFCKYFEMLFICCENPSFVDRVVNCGWKYQIHEDSWVAGISAGGDLNSCESGSFARSPSARLMFLVPRRYVPPESPVSHSGEGGG